MIKAVVFGNRMEKIDGRSCCGTTDKLEYFCEINNISKEHIINVSLSNGDKHGIRDKILLMYYK